MYLNKYNVEKIFIVFSLLLLGLFIYADKNEVVEISPYPDGKDFALSITDDPDYGWMEQKEIVYNFLAEHNFRTTIPVWVLDNKHGTGSDGVNSGVGGITTTNGDYLRFTKELQSMGFEIALHTVGPGNDFREETMDGYELFKKHFGHYPNININHTSNLDNIYWGGERFSNKLLKFIYNRFGSHFQGNEQSSKYFWGDIALDKTKYMRGWATDDINTLSINESMPYHLEDKPYVNYWFSCSDGYNINKFIRLLSDENIKKLVDERGTSIIYTHFGYGFVDKVNNTLNEEFIDQMGKVSKLDGWFVPVSTILDRFLLLQNVEIIETGKTIKIINNNDQAIRGLTILSNLKKLYFVNADKWILANKDGEIILGDIPPYSVFKLRETEAEQKKETLETIERMRMVLSWFIGRFNK